MGVLKNKNKKPWLSSSNYDHNTKIAFTRYRLPGLKRWPLRWTFAWILPNYKKLPWNYMDINFYSYYYCYYYFIFYCWVASCFGNTDLTGHFSFFFFFFYKYFSKILVKITVFKSFCLFGVSEMNGHRNFDFFF